MKQLLTALLFSLPTLGMAAPGGLAPGYTTRAQAESKLSAPTQAGARLRFAPPAGAPYASVEVYLGRQSKVAEVIEYRYEAADPAPLRSALGKATFAFTPAAGGSAEVFLESRAVLYLTPEGKARAVSYLSSEALASLAELYPQKADRSTPEKALQAVLWALASGREAELKACTSSALPAEDVSVTDPKTKKVTVTPGFATFKAQRRALLAHLDGYQVELMKPKPGVTDAVLLVKHPVLGLGAFIFAKEGDQWMVKGFPNFRPDTSGKSPLGAVRALTAPPAAPVPGVVVKAPPAALVESLKNTLGEGWSASLASMPLSGGYLSAPDSATLYFANDTQRLALTASRDAKGVWTVVSASTEALP
jgi:hypothetical protein